MRYIIRKQELAERLLKAIESDKNDVDVIRQVRAYRLGIKRAERDYNTQQSYSNARCIGPCLED